MIVTTILVLACNILLGNYSRDSKRESLRYIWQQGCSGIVISFTCIILYAILNHQTNMKIDATHVSLKKTRKRSCWWKCSVLFLKLSILQGSPKLAKPITTHYWDRDRHRHWWLHTLLVDVLKVMLKCVESPSSMSFWDVSLSSLRYSIHFN
jgi:hypothetical protein